jgi:hypothetical protein
MMSRRKNPKVVIAGGLGLLGAYPIWQWTRGLEMVQQLYAGNPMQEFMWMMGILVITASIIAGCVYAVLAWFD